MMATPSNGWPLWEQPDEETSLAMVQAVAKFVRFLAPSIVEQIVEDNNRNRAKWRDGLKRLGINPDIYLWEKSCCAFPGIRRHVGAKEQARLRKVIAYEKASFPDAFRIDSNVFPRHIWSFILCGKKAGTSGPGNYALAHLADHKEYNIKRRRRFIPSNLTLPKRYGLFTCPSNTVYSPSNLIRMSDFHEQTRDLLLRRAEELYGRVCNLLPPPLQIPAVSSPQWNTDKFEWAPTVGDGADLTEFFTFRKDILSCL